MENKLSIIIPVYNESESITILYEEIISLELSYIYEIIILM